MNNAEQIDSLLYVKIHINEIAKRIVITPSHRDDNNALKWCAAKQDKRISRRIVGKPFSERVYKLMGWNDNRRYKSMGFRITVNTEGQIGYLFDLNLTESFENIKRPRRKRNDSEISESDNLLDSQKINLRQEALFSEPLITSFGDPATETEDIYNLINLEDYTTFSANEHEKLI